MGHYRHVLIIILYVTVKKIIFKSIIWRIP